MKNFGPLILALLLIVVLSTAALSAAGPSVTFLNPGGKDDPFFGMMTNFMQAAADDLGIDLETIHCGRDHIAMREEGFKILERETLPEYLILINEKNGAVDILYSAATKGVKVILVNEGFLPDSNGVHASPDSTTPNWIFEFIPDDKQAGYLLAKSLIAAAEAAGQHDANGKIGMAAVSGSFQTSSSSERVAGLLLAVKEHEDVELKQVVPALWEEDKARMIAYGLFDRYPDTDIVWSASDLMARGILSAAKRKSRDIITGGIDWADFAIRMVANGEMTATVGGHFMDGGWALVMLYDLHHGIPVKQQRYMSQFSLIDKSNAALYLKRFGDQNWGAIDFRKFSKKLNPELTEYRFGLEPVMKQLQVR